MLTFREEDHSYRWNDQPVVSVTQVISEILGGPPDTEAVRRKGELGTAAHETIALDLAGDLDEASVDPQVAPYLAAARLFLKETGIVADHVEKRLYSDRYKVAGTIDFIGGGLLVDWKCGEPRKHYQLQTGAYQLLASENGIAVAKRACVYLRADGDYRFEEHKNRVAAQANFIALLAAYQVREMMK